MAKILQGYTNVISPQNLFTDSHFERGGGIPQIILTLHQADLMSPTF